MWQSPVTPDPSAMSPAVGVARDEQPAAHAGLGEPVAEPLEDLAASQDPIQVAHRDHQVDHHLGGEPGH